MIPTLRHVGAGVLLAALAWSGSQAAEPKGAPTAVEKLYQDLYKLDPAERHKRLLEGAKTESRAEVGASMRGKEGRGITDAFLKEYPTLKASFDGAAGQDRPERIIAEERSGRHMTDSISASVADLSPILEQNIQANYPTPANNNILPQYRAFMDKDNRWLVSHWNEHGIVYNEAMVKPEDAPKSWEDLCNPKYKGQISYETVETRWLAGIYTMYGGDEKKVSELMKCLGANEPIIAKGHTTRLMLMLAGDHPISADQFFYLGTDMRNKNPKKAPFKAVYEAPVFAYAVAMLINKNAPNPHTTALYLDWVLGPTSQRMLGEVMRGPVTIKHPYFPDNVTLVQFGEMDVAVIERLHGFWNQYMTKK